MNLSEMKLEAMNVVKAYFKRDWRREDLTNRGKIPSYAHKCLNKVAFEFVLPKYLFGIDQGFVFSYLAGITIGFGTFWVGAMLTSERSLYARRLLVSYILIYIWLFIASRILGCDTAWIQLVWPLLACYMGYIVVYSKDVMYDARFGDVDFVNRAFTHLFHLPAILVHFTPLRMAAAVERYKQKKH